MCRNIRTLYNFEPTTTHDEVHAAALQYVRKVSGMTKPSRANEEAFARAVEAVAHVTEHLLDELVTTAAAARPRGRGGAAPGPLLGQAGQTSIRPGRQLARHRDEARGLAGLPGHALDHVVAVALDRGQRAVGVHGLDDAHVIGAEEDEVAGRGRRSAGSSRPVERPSS